MARAFVHPRTASAIASLVERRSLKTQRDSRIAVICGGLLGATIALLVGLPLLVAVKIELRSRKMPLADSRRFA